MIRGQRFEVDLDADGDSDGQNGSPLPGAFIGNVFERKPAAPTAPSAPSLKNKTGFPEHRKRKVDTRFNQRKTSGEDKSSANPTVSSTPQQDEAADAVECGKAKSWEEEERQRIDLENRRKLDQMSTEEIEEERQELMNSLSPALLQRLLQRSNLDSGSNEAILSTQSQNGPTESIKPKKANLKTVSFIDPTEVDNTAPEQEFEDENDNDNDDREAPLAESLPHDSVHFPQPPQPPELDPSSETFLDDLHMKYFPSLPSDTDKLEWMRTSDSTKTTYDPSASALNPKDLRFSFKGELIAPKTASAIPVIEGLHHHGDAPEAAGYTIPELAHLAHSSFAPQRCIAFQTLGRILYRLGSGEFGDSGEPGADTAGAEDTMGELARGLWREMEREKVIETLVNESEGRGVDRGRHVSAKAYATEAVWLWRRGGGRRWKAS